MDIDYTKLNDRIVKQAYEASEAFLNEAQLQKLFQNKIRRATEMLAAREVYYQIED